MIMVLKASLAHRSKKEIYAGVRPAVLAENHFSPVDLLLHLYQHTKFYNI